MRTSPDVARAYGLWSPFAGPMPDGALLAAFHSAGGESHDVFVMKKLEDRWGFWVFSPSGTPKPANDDLCRRCHQEAPSDLVFGGVTAADAEPASAGEHQ